MKYICEYTGINYIISIHVVNQLLNITMAPNPPDPPIVHFIVRFRSGMLIAVSLPTSSTVATLKQTIDSRVNMAPHNQRIVYKGNRLSDESTLASHNILPMFDEISCVTHI